MSQDGTPTNPFASPTPGPAPDAPIPLGLPASDVPPPPDPNTIWPYPGYPAQYPTGLAPNQWNGYQPFQSKPFFSYARFRNGQAVAKPWPGAPLQAIDAGLAGRSLRVPRWGIPDSVASQVLAIAVPFGFIALFYALTPNQWGYNVAAIFASLLLEWTFLGGWPLLVSYRRGNGPRLDFGLSLSWHDVGPGALGAVTCLFGAGIAAAVTHAIFGDFGSTAGQVADDLAGHPWAHWIFLCLGVFGAPLIEELAFRGLLWGALAKRRINPWWCTVITAVVFAAVHLEPVRFGVLLVAGLVLGLLRQSTGRLGPSILAHVGLNAIAFVGTGFIFFG
jgi:membrane protease YdiL (CAAX protease family)